MVEPQIPKLGNRPRPPPRPIYWASAPGKEPAQKCQNRNFCNLLSTSKMLRVFIRSPLPACGGPHRAKKLLLYLVAASVGLAGTPYVHWCFGVSKPV